MGVPNLAKIEPIVAKMIPPEGSKVVGQTEDGRVIYERTVVRGRNVPAVDEEGNQKYELHPTTALPLYPRRKLEKVETTYRFTLFDPGNGNVREELFVEPDPAEIERVRRERAIAEAQRELAAALVDEGMSAGELVSALKRRQKPEKAA